MYKEHKVAVALPHLIIIVDEFAELKKEVPEFMQEIISVSQVEEPWRASAVVYAKAGWDCG